MYHTLDVKASFKSLKSSKDGLTLAGAKAKLKEYGPNELIQSQRFPVAKRLLAQFTDLLVIILIIAGLAAFALGEKVDAGVILGIVVLNALIGFFQEFKAERSLEALRSMVEPTALVLRDGKEQKINAKHLVPGDIIVLSEGNKIPADCRLVETVSFQTQEATLTGESVPVSKFIRAIKDVPVSGQSNMVFMGTIVVKGRAKALVTATGMKTEFGKIADMTQVVQEEPSPLQQELFHVGKFIGKATLLICLFVFTWGVLSGHELFSMFLFAVSLAVAAVPEGLPATVTIALAMGVQRMAGKKSIVRRLASVETLGSATVICSDKTGTLTKNEMTVKALYANDKLVEVTGAGYRPKGDFYSGETLMGPKDLDEFHHLLCIASLCNDANLVTTEKAHAWGILGDPTEGALIVAGEKMKLDLDVLRDEYPRVDEIPFDSVSKRMTTIHTHGKEKVAFMKGAPDEVIKRCTKISVHGKVFRLTKEKKLELLKQNKKMASQALRVLAFAYRELPKGKNEIEENLTFLGLMGMLDPPREGVKEAVKLCKDAGIKITIITGDFGVTAQAVAKDIGINADLVIDGEELERMTDDDLDEVLEKDIIFSRASPKHKLRIVSALQQKGHIVAVTGDGVNDAPALKKAEIGVAMGISGTDVSKESSDMILTDDSFSAIVQAIKEGRTIYDDIQKFFRYVFSSNIGELMTIFFGMLLGLPLPLLATQILWVDLGTDVLPALALGIDPSEKDVMSRKPRNPKTRMITLHKFFMWLLAGTVIGAGTIVAYLLTLDQGIPKARTVAFTLMVMYQMVNVFNCRSNNESLFKVGLLSNPYLLATVAFSISLQVLVVYTPFLQTLFHTVPLALGDWLLILGFSLTIFVYDEIRKRIGA